MIEYRISYKAYEVTNKINSWNDKVLKNLERATQAAALLVQAYAKKNIQQGSRSGRIYARGTTRHQASAPGEWPKTDTGRLASSIRTDFNGYLRAAVGSDLNYSQSLELGADKIAPRPWLKRSLDENNERIEALFNEAIAKGLA